MAQRGIVKQLISRLGDFLLHLFNGFWIVGHPNFFYADSSTECLCSRTSTLDGDLPRPSGITVDRFHSQDVQLASLAENHLPGT